MCLSFQYGKHLSTDRGGMILLDSESDASKLRKMAYDGRERTDLDGGNKTYQQLVITTT